MSQGESIQFTVVWPNDAVIIKRHTFRHLEKCSPLADGHPNGRWYDQTHEKPCDRVVINGSSSQPSKRSLQWHNSDGTRSDKIPRGTASASTHRVESATTTRPLHCKTTAAIRNIRKTIILFILQASVTS